MDMILWIDYIGYLGPVLLFLITLIVLINKKIYLTYYIIGSILNFILNLLLKGIIQDPRPNQDKKLFEILHKNNQRIGSDKYGMPSGHAQSVAFSLIFIYLVTHNPILVNIYLVITVLTIYQRNKYNNHTIGQLVIGIITGLSFGYLCCYISNKYIVGKIRMKKDDNGPI